jgi:phosphatidate cytidylyltransferase
MGDLSLVNPFIPAVIFLVIIGRIISKRDLKRAFADVSITFFGIFLISWLMGYQILLRNLDNGSNLILLLYTIIWIGDSAAYAIGSSIGKHKLAPVLSPGKSWEGAVAGLIAGIGMAFIAKFSFFDVMNYRDCLILGFGLSIFGQLGDISESMFKRGAEVKDSGSLIPGHGGILDKMDSLLYTSPALYYYYKYFMG